MSDVAAFDVCVIGGGPAGAATARWLAGSGCRVVLVEATSYREPRIGDTLAPSVQPLLRELGVWDAFLATRPQASYGTRSVWGSAAAQVHSHLFTPWGSGWHVDRLAFDRMLAEAAIEVGASGRLATSVVSGQRVDGGWWLQLVERGGIDEGERRSELTARVVIEATGRSARFAPWAGARRQVIDRLVAVAVELGGGDLTAESFLSVETRPDEWWYAAPLPGDRMMAMLMTDGDLWRCPASRSLAPWFQRLVSAPETAGRLTSRLPVDGPHVIPAMSQRLRRNDRTAPWLAVGDAALSVDPISGSGVVRALRTARAAAAATMGLLEGTAEQPIAGYEQDRDAEWDAYLAERSAYYGLEGRWPESLFWRRRHEREAPKGAPSPAPGETWEMAGHPRPD